MKLLNIILSLSATTILATTVCQNSASIKKQNAVAAESLTTTFNGYAAPSFVSTPTVQNILGNILT
jgi:hypothetical protein